MPDHDPDVTPEQETRLRRLLAQARHGEPVPDDVAARLDRVLEQLQADGLDPDGDRSVVDLAARRRRRVTTLLVAAAAVVVVGVGVGQVTKSSESDTASVESSAGGDSSQSLSDDLAEAEDQRKFDGSSEFETFPGAPAPNAASGDASESGAAPHPPVVLTTEGFAKQAVRYRNRPGVEALVSSVVPGEALSLSESFVCDTASWGEGRLLAALYDDVPAVLAYRPVAGETQTVDLLRCGSGEVLRSTVLPVEG
jgi:hypothetical protein